MKQLREQEPIKESFHQRGDVLAQQRAPSGAALFEGDMVHRRRRFEHTLLSGVIDRLVLWSSGDRIIAAELFDFKTDLVNDAASFTERVETYRPQLDSYRRAVVQLFSLKSTQVAAKLLFVQRDEVVEV